MSDAELMVNRLCAPFNREAHPVPRAGQCLTFTCSGFIFLFQVVEFCIFTDLQMYISVYGEQGVSEGKYGVSK